MLEWWKQNEKIFPELDDQEKEELQDITGCVPLLLHGLLDSQSTDFKGIKSQLLQSKEIRNIRRQLNNFHSKMKNK